jgi:hypothetical protein
MDNAIKKRLEEAKALQLPKDVSEKYDLVGIAGAGKIVTKKLNGQLVTLDLSRITVEQADKLVENKFKYLVKKRNSVENTSSTKDAKKS